MKMNELIQDMPDEPISSFFDFEPNTRLVANKNRTTELIKSNVLSCQKKLNRFPLSLNICHF
jgi:hypothetical protein